MPPADGSNVFILDQMIRRRIWVERYSTGAVQRALALLVRVEKDMVAKIAAMAATGRDPIIQERLLTEVRAIMADGYAGIDAEIRGDLTNFGGEEARFQNRVLSAVAGFEASIPAAVQVMAAATARPFQGRYLSEWLAGLEDGATARVRDAVRIGFVQGESIDAIVRRIRGTRAAGYRDGILEISRRGAQAMVRTAVSHTATMAQQLASDAFGDILADDLWVSVLDSRTTPICQSLSGKTFPRGKGPYPPQHISCRSSRVSLVKGLPVPQSENYQDWLTRQPTDTQDEVLGPTRGALFRRGGLELTSFVDPRGRTITLEHLRQMEPAAFTKANLN